MKHWALLTHQRKRNKQTSTKFEKIIDLIVFFMAIAMPLTAIPQIIKIWHEKTAQGVSLLMWSLWLISVIPMLIYSFIHKEKPLVLMYLLWTVVYVIIISGLLIYG